MPRLSPHAPAAICLAEKLTPLRGIPPVLREVDICLLPGDALILTGDNGAGKTTLLRALSGLLPLFAGEVVIEGHSLARAPAAAQSRLLLIGHTGGFADALTPTEALFFQARMRGLPATRADIAATLADTGAEPRHAHTPMRILSAGQKRRMVLAQLGLLNRLGATAATPLWLLDEPATALDRNGLAILARDIDRHLGRGGAAIIASHSPIPLAAKSRRIAVIKSGRLTIEKPRAKAKRGAA